MAEDQGANRPGDKSDSKSSQRRQSGRGRIGQGKKQMGKRQDRRRALDVKIEELDGGPNQAREKHLERRVDGAPRQWIF